MLLAAGCGFQGGGAADPGAVSSEPVSPAPDTPEVKALKERSLGYLEQFHAGDFESILADATDKVREALEKDKLAEIWAGATEKLGEFEAVAVVECGEESDLRSVAVTENYAEMGFQTIFTYNPEGKLSGFHIRETKKAEVGDIARWVNCETAPDFLNAEQQALFREAVKLYICFRGNSAYIDFGYPADGGMNDPNTIWVDGVRYCEAQGQFRKWDDFMEKMLSVFTQEWFDGVNPVMQTLSSNGKERCIISTRMREAMLRILEAPLNSSANPKSRFNSRL